MQVTKLFLFIPVKAENVLEDPGRAVEEELPCAQREGVAQREYFS